MAPEHLDPLIVWVVVVALIALTAAVTALGAAVRRLRRDLRRTADHRPAAETDVAALKADLAQALRHVAVVRYDAFGDMGGRLSFSAAIVDDHGDGVVVSGIHARGESRTYAKGIVDGRSDVTLTPEEQRALAAARTGTVRP